jgi:hypothetical protein
VILQTDRAWHVHQQRAIGAGQQQQSATLTSTILRQSKKESVLKESIAISKHFKNQEPVMQKKLIQRPGSSKVKK